MILTTYLYTVGFSVLRLILTNFDQKVVFLKPEFQCSFLLTSNSRANWTGTRIENFEFAHGLFDAKGIIVSVFR